MSEVTSKAAADHIDTGVTLNPVCSISISNNEQTSVLTELEKSTLSRFNSHSLADLPEESLMNRVDKKFVVPRPLLADLMSHMCDEYTALEVEGKRAFRYHNTYFDSASYSLYLDHHNGKSNRYKIRQRTYVDSELSFLEVKFKNNKRRTIKSRLLVEPQDQNFDCERAEFLTENGLRNHSAFGPTQTGSYVRIALANRELDERITLDIDLSFEDILQERSYSLGPWVVVEVKQLRQNRTSTFFRWAQKNGIRKSKFSKYCMGVYFTGPTSLKRNNFHRVAKQLRFNPLHPRTESSGLKTLR